MLNRFTAVTAALLVAAASAAGVTAEALTESRAIFDIYGAAAEPLRPGLWRVDEREVTILLDASFQDGGEPRGEVHGQRGRSAMPWGALPTGMVRTCVWVFKSMTDTRSAQRLVTSAWRPVGSMMTRSG